MHINFVCLRILRMLLYAFSIGDRQLQGKYKFSKEKSKVCVCNSKAAKFERFVACLFSRMQTKYLYLIIICTPPNYTYLFIPHLSMLYPGEMCKKFIQY